MNNCKSQHRRHFLLSSMTLAAALPLVAAIQTFSRAAQAQTPPADVDVKDPVAVAQDYVKDIDKAKTKPKDHKPSRYCWNCLLYNGNFEPKDAKSKDLTTKASCAIFGMKRVGYADWCKSWAEDAGMKGKTHFKSAGAKKA